MNERMNFEGSWVNLFSFSVAHAGSFARYLDIITERYRKANAEYRRQFTVYKAAIDALVPDGPSVQEGFLEASAGIADRSTRLQFEIECFYVFANIFLDRLAMNVEYVFGQARRLPLGSHHELVQHLAKYAEDRALTPVPDQLIADAVALRRRITDYRDDEIAHARNPRRFKGTSLSQADPQQAKISIGRIYPTMRELATPVQTESETPEELGREIDAYVREFIAYLRANLSRARGRRS